MIPDHPKLVPAMSMPDDKPDTPAPEYKGARYADIVYVDIETTGMNLNPKDGGGPRRESAGYRMIEFAAWRHDEDMPTALRFRVDDEQKAKMRRDDDWAHAKGKRSASDVTGFWEREADFDAAPTFAEQADVVRGELCPKGRQGFLVGHNIAMFDWPWLQNELCAIAMPGHWGFPGVDTLILSRLMFARHGQKRFSLDACREFLGLPPEGTHTADGGVRACKEYVDQVADCAVLGKWVLEQFPGMTKREVCQQVLAKSKEVKVSNGE